MSIQLIYTDINGYQLNEEERDKLTGALPPYFADKARAAKNDTLKLQRLASGLLLTYVMKQKGYGPDGIVITEAEQGKPMFIRPEGFYFNLSHSDSLVLLAAGDAEVGCDIQKVKDGKKIAERFFTEDEKSVLDETEEADKGRSFTRLWARKESYIKATGEGMRRDLRSFSVLEDAMPDGYVISDCDLGDYCAAVCIHGSSWHGDICLIPFQKIVNVIS